MKVSFAAAPGRSRLAGRIDPCSLVPTVGFVAGGASEARFPGFSNVNGRSRAALSSLSGTTIVLVIGGQSNATSSFPTPYVPSNGTVYTFNIYDGGLYSSKDPQLGCSAVAQVQAPYPQGHWAGRLADKLITAGKATNVILVPMGIAGSAIADWAQAGANFNRWTVTGRRLATAGITPTAILFQQGESDLELSTTQVNYAAALLSMTNGIAAIWPSTPVFVAQASWESAVTSAPVRAAQAAAVNHPLIWAGPDADSLNATNRQSDNTHFNDTGCDALATLWKTALGLYGAPF